MFLALVPLDAVYKVSNMGVKEDKPRTVWNEDAAVHEERGRPVPVSAMTTSQELLNTESIWQRM